MWTPNLEIIFILVLQRLAIFVELFSLEIVSFVAFLHQTLSFQQDGDVIQKTAHILTVRSPCFRFWSSNDFRVCTAKACHLNWVKVPNFPLNSCLCRTKIQFWRKCLYVFAAGFCYRTWFWIPSIVFFCFKIVILMHRTWIRISALKLVFWSTSFNPMAEMYRKLWKRRLATLSVKFALSSLKLLSHTLLWFLKDIFFSKLATIFILVPVWWGRHSDMHYIFCNTRRNCRKLWVVRNFKI